jgi:hypothetical protein
LRSTWVTAEGTQTTTRGLLTRPRQARWSSMRMSRAVVSKSEMAPPRSGRTTTMCPGVRPIMAYASSPRAMISPVPSFSAITVGCRS